MRSGTGLTSWDKQGVTRYVEERREHLEPFLRECFSFPETCRVLWRSLRSDLFLHALNLTLAIPKLFINRVSGVVEKLGWYGLARAIQSVTVMLRPGFERARERQILVGLIGAPEDPAVRRALDGPLSQFMATRAAILELAGGGLAIALAYLLFGHAGLSPLEMGRTLAAEQAQHQAASGFFLGRGVGNGFYRLFPPHPTWAQLATSSALVIALLGVTAAVLVLVSDPVQQAAGIHRRQLRRLLDSFEDNLLIEAARRPQILERSPERALANRVQGHTEGLASQKSERSMRHVLSSLWRKLTPLRKELERRQHAGRRLARRFGLRNSVLASMSLLCLLTLGLIMIKRQLHPYAEVMTLIEQRAYVTALARLDQMPRKNGKRAAEYWFWRGQALFGNRQLDAAIEAYQSAIAKSAAYRSDATILQHAIEAVATKNQERAKRLILEQIGPEAIEPLREKALAREDIQRWPLVELIKKLGGESHINYAEIAIADLSCASTCAAKKRAVEKVLEYRITDAVYALRELDGEPEYKCLQGVLKQTFVSLAGTESRKVATSKTRTSRR